MLQLINRYPQLNVSNPYLFLKQELEITKLHPNEYNALKNAGWIRHCKQLRNGRLYDYILKQEYTTIEQWVASWKPTSFVDLALRMGTPTVRDVCYGIHRNQAGGLFQTKYVVPFGWKDDEGVPSITDQMKQLVDHLNSKNIGMSSVMVNFNGVIMPLNIFMNI
jgi:hypothetical protein